MKTTTTMMITNRHILYQYTRPVRQTQVCKYTDTLYPSHLLSQKLTDVTIGGPAAVTEDGASLPET